MVDCRDVVQSSARRVVAVLSTFSSLKEKKLDPRNKAFVKVMSRNSFERIFRSGPMLLLSCMLFSPLTLVSIFFAFSSAHGKDKASSQNYVCPRCFLTTFRRDCTEEGRWNLGEIFSSLRDHDVPLMYRTLSMYRYD